MLDKLILNLHNDCETMLAAKLSNLICSRPDLLIRKRVILKKDCIAVRLSVKAVRWKVCVDIVFYCAIIRKN